LIWLLSTFFSCGLRSIDASSASLPGCDGAGGRQVPDGGGGPGGGPGGDG